VQQVSGHSCIPWSLPGGGAQLEYSHVCFSNFVAINELSLRGSLVLHLSIWKDIYTICSYFQIHERKQLGALARKCLAAGKSRLYKEMLLSLPSIVYNYTGFLKQDVGMFASKWAVYTGYLFRHLL
jgi:hypothetical protein